ncbi:MAG: hypothetical protein ACE5KZ_08705 [Candidatus Scalinduaceae bacterium]
MTILLLAMLWWTLSSRSIDDSPGTDYLAYLDRPNIDIVRQLNHAKRVSDKKSHYSSNYDGKGEEIGSKIERKILNINNNMSVERINAFRKYIASRTLDSCDFTCHRCYRCFLVYGELESESTKELFLEE